MYIHVAFTQAYCFAVYAHHNYKQIQHNLIIKLLSAVNEFDETMVYVHVAGSSLVNSTLALFQIMSSIEGCV